MPEIVLTTIVKADLKTCFDLSRDIDFHTKSLQHSKEKAISGKTSGLIGLGESVTWEAIHFGVKQQLTSKITAFNPPHFFIDEMVSGAFKSFKHEHHFQTKEDYTIITDKFYFISPFGWLGKLADKLIVKRYIRKLLETRNFQLKIEAEKKAKL